MADIILAQNATTSLADTIQSIYTATAASSGGKGVRITAFTAANNSAASSSYKAYIYDSTATPNNARLPQKIIVKDRFDLGSAIIGHIIPAGGSLRVETSTSAAIDFSVMGNSL